MKDRGSCNGMGGVLAIDHGERKTGFAVSDGLRIAVHPLSVLRAEGGGEELLDHVESLLAERDVDAIVVGMPYHMDGTEGDRAQAVRAFIARLGARLGEGIDLHLWDERLTTKEAEGRLREAGYRGREISSRRDSWSAMVLLEDWIASQSR
jgi:putative holliday junction resolvase